MVVGSFSNPLPPFKIPGAVNDGFTPLPNNVPANNLPRGTNLCGNQLGIPGNTVCSELAYYSN